MRRTIRRFCRIGLILGMTLLAAAAWGEKGDTFLYVAGTQTVAPKYGFTREDRLIETAKAIRHMGSNVLKIHMAKEYATTYTGLPKSSEIHSLTDLAAKEPSYRAVFDMPFGHYLLWVYPFASGLSWQDGFTEAEQKVEYEEIYAFVRHLLTQYNRTGKTFYLGHWEGDWYLHPGYDITKDPSPVALQGMIDWLNTRQKAVDAAKRDTPHTDVQVWHYTEVNLAQKAMRGGKTLTNDVLPKTQVDFVSYSSYDSLIGEGETLRANLKKALDYIETKLPAKPGVPGKRVFIGEYGFPRINVGPEKQATLSRDVIQAALEWGCPFALYWQMYCNEVTPEGKHRGFWLIDEKGEKQSVYHLHHKFLTQAQQWVAVHRKKKKRMPTFEEYRKHALSLLKNITLTTLPKGKDL